MNQDQLYIEFAIKILDLISEDDLNNKGAMNRLKLHYAKMEEADIQDAILNYCDYYDVHYILSYSPETMLHTVIFKSNIWTAMPDIEVSRDDATDALVLGCLKVYDRIALLGENKRYGT